MDFSLYSRAADQLEVSADLPVHEHRAPHDALIGTQKGRTQSTPPITRNVMTPAPPILRTTLACPKHLETSLVTTATEAFCTFGGERYPIIDGVVDFGAAEPNEGNVIGQALASAAAMHVYDRYQRITEGVGVTPAFTSRVALIRAFANLGEGRIGLDLGCGLGRVTRALAAFTGSGGMVGLDFRRELVRVAARSAPTEGESLFVQGDPMALPFKDGAFDAVYCGATLHQVTDPAAFLEGIHRVLRPGGRLVLETVAARRAGLVRRAQRAVRRVSGIQFADTDTLYQRLTSSGFEQREEVIDGASLILAAIRR